MKKSIIVLGLVALFVAACGSEKTEKSAEVKLAKVDISVPTLQCKMCVNNVKSGLADVAGVKDVKIDLDKKVASVSYDNASIDVAGIEAKIAATGYDANETKRNMDAYDELDACCQIPEEGEESHH